MTLTAPLIGCFAIGMLGLITVKLHTKCEVSVFTLHEYTKSEQMYNMGWFGVIRGYSRSTAMLPFDGRETALMDTLCLFRIVYTTWHICYTLCLKKTRH